METLDTSSDKLREQLFQLQDHVKESYLSDDRILSIKREMSYIVFELMERALEEYA